MMFLLSRFCIHVFVETSYVHPTRRITRMREPRKKIPSDYKRFERFYFRFYFRSLSAFYSMILSRFHFVHFLFQSMDIDTLSTSYIRVKLYFLRNIARSTPSFHSISSHVRIFNEKDVTIRTPEASSKSFSLAIARAPTSLVSNLTLRIYRYPKENSDTCARPYE